MCVAFDAALLASLSLSLDSVSRNPLALFSLSLSLSVSLCAFASRRRSFEILVLESFVQTRFED